MRTYDCGEVSNAKEVGTIRKQKVYEISDDYYVKYEEVFDGDRMCHYIRIKGKHVKHIEFYKS